MNRRYFVKNTLAFSVLSSLAITGTLREFVLQHPVRKQRALVLIQLDGGNDGLNTVIPLDQYTNLNKARKNILIPDKKVLPLYNSSITGLHPAMPELQHLYNDKKVTIVQGVSCRQPDLSHFKAIDIWHTGSDAATTFATGWVGRFADHTGEGQADPPAIQVQASVSKAYQGANAVRGMAVWNIDNFYDLVINDYEAAPKNTAGNQLTFIRNATKESKQYLSRVQVASKKQKTLSKKYPAAGTNPLADQLKIVARLVGGGLQTKIYTVSLKGFDTHDKQVDFADTTKGDHAELLGQLSVAIAAFEDDLALMGKQDEVLGMTYSEFGRRIKSNDSYGCDHGTAAPVILFGSKLNSGLVGNNPVIASDVSVNDNLPLQYDFRQVYTSILQHWFEVPDAQLTAITLNKYAPLNLFKS